MKNQKFDKILLIILFILLGFGLIMIASGGIAYSQTRFGDDYFFLKRQIFYGIIPGLFVFYIFQKIDYHYWKKIAIPLFFLSLIFLILVFIPGLGIKTYGASRWLQLGPLSFQPSEMAKLAIILYLSLWLESKGRNSIRDMMEGFLPFLAIVGSVGFLIIKQPDMGTLGVLMITAIFIFFASGAKLTHLISMGVAGFLTLAILIKISPYRFNRFMTFINPQNDPQGIGYHINQALLAIGSGGILGLGLGHSRQKFNYLPEPVGDSIFAIIGEELGMVGGIILITLFVAFALRGLKIAKNAPDDFGKLVAIGVTSWIIVQAFINISAISGIMPLTGVPLPFISYGGTSLVFLMAGVGILLNISKKTKLE